MRLFILIIFTVLVSPSNVLAKDQTVIFGYYTNKMMANSMAPTLIKGDYVLSNPSYYEDKTIARTDIVLIESPKGDGKLWTKRIIGIPGDKLSIKENKIYINSKALHENYVSNKNNIKNLPIRHRDLTLQPNQYFVLGDNRDNSFDSRFFGPIGAEKIKGKVIRIYFSKDISRIGKIN